MKRVFLSIALLFAIGLALSNDAISTWVANKTTVADDDILLFQDSSEPESSKTAYITFANIKTWVLSFAAATLGADDNYVTDAEKTVIGNTSGTNTGDQDLSGYELSLGNPASNGYVLSSTTGGTRSWIAMSGSFPGFTDLDTDYGLAIPLSCTTDGYQLEWDAATSAYVCVEIPTLPGVTITELGYVAGGTSNFQDQINGKQAADADLTEWALISPTSGNIYTTGTIQGAVKTYTKASSGTLTAQEVSGGFVVATAGGTQTLPTAVAGYSVCLYAGQGVTAAIGIQPATGDYLVVDGVRGAAATARASSGAAGDRICVIAADNTDWYVIAEAGTWAE